MVSVSYLLMVSLSRESVADADEADDAHKLLEEIDSIDRDVAASLRTAGYTTPDDLREATQSELSDIDGIGKLLAARIKSDVAEDSEHDDTDVDSDDLAELIEGADDDGIEDLPDDIDGSSTRLHCESCGFYRPITEVDSEHVASMLCPDCENPLTKKTATDER